MFLSMTWKLNNDLMCFSWRTVQIFTSLWEWTEDWKMEHRKDSTAVTKIQFVKKFKGYFFNLPDSHHCYIHRDDIDFCKKVLIMAKVWDQLWHVASLWMYLPFYKVDNSFVSTMQNSHCWYSFEHYFFSL